MARSNKINAGPFTEARPQVTEALAGAALIPGMVVTLAVVAGVKTFSPAAANATGQLYVVQDNYLVLAGTDTAIAVGDTAIGIHLNDAELLRLRIPTGQNVSEGEPLNLIAGGKISKAAGRLVGYAAETYNNTTGKDELILVRVGNHAPAAA